MPAYDYVCLKCGKEFEFTQRITEDPLERCIDGTCDGAVRRRMGKGAGIIFKGSGFYETDYKRKGNGGTPVGESKSESSDSSSSGAAASSAKSETSLKSESKKDAASSSGTN